jgi:hypothetical protein
VIWRDDFRICTHLFFHENFGCVFGDFFLFVCFGFRGGVFGLVSGREIAKHTHRNTKPKGKGKERKKERQMLGKGENTNIKEKWQ